jgi:putative transposase
MSDSTDRLSWPHAPVHRLTEHGIYFVTAATLHHAHHFRSKARLEVLQRGLLAMCAQSEWRLEAWAVFSNHYHFVAESPGTAESLPVMLGTLHEKLSKWVNKLDAAPGRQVWHNYWETKLEEQPTYFAWLNYTHQNAVRHGLVKVAKDYPWCSASWFEQHTSPAMVKSIYRFKTDKIADDFAVDADW